MSRFQFPRNENPGRTKSIIDFQILAAVADEIGAINVLKYGGITLEQIQVVLLALELTGMVVSARELEVAQQTALELKAKLDLATNAGDDDGK